MTTKTRPSPRIAVIVPAYGVAHLLGEALDSLLGQTFADWEAIIIDDGAPDDVRGAVAPYLGDSRFRFLETDNHGVSSARNRAIKEATAPYIALLDGDDLFRPAYLMEMVAALDAHPDASIVTCNAGTFGAIPENGTVVSPGQNLHSVGTLEEVLDRRFNIYIGSSFRKSAFDAIGGYDTSMTHAEDLDFWVRLLMECGPVYYIDKILGDYRIRETSASTDRIKLLRGQIRVYQKVEEGTADAATRHTAARLRAEAEQEEHLESAITRVINGDTRDGLRQLQLYKSGFDSPVWKLAFWLWKPFPSLAPRMLAWRRRRHVITPAQAVISTPVVRDKA